jgi:hypothetical protein
MASAKMFSSSLGARCCPLCSQATTHPSESRFRCSERGGRDTRIDIAVCRLQLDCMVVPFRACGREAINVGSERAGHITGPCGEDL